MGLDVRTATSLVQRWRNWNSLQKVHLATEARFTTLASVFIGLTVPLVALPPRSLVLTIIAFLWFSVLTVLLFSLPVLVIHFFKEWKVFKSIVSLDPVSATPKWASGKLGIFLAFLHLRRVPSDPIRDYFIQLAAFVHKASPNNGEGRK